MGTVNHWGKWVSDNVPVGGVVSVNGLDFEYVDSRSVVDLRFEGGLTEYKREKESEFVKAFWDSLPAEDEREYIDPIPTAEQIAEWEEEYSEYDQPPGRLLVGSWVKDGGGLWEVDRAGEFAAIVDYDSMIAQIVYSQWVTRGALCSPCYPGQVDLDTPGAFMGYDFPPDLYAEDEFADRNAPQPYSPPATVEYTVIVKVVRVINGVVTDNYYDGEIEGLFTATAQAPRGDLQRVNNIARGAWNIIDDQLRSIPQ